MFVEVIYFILVNFFLYLAVKKCPQCQAENLHAMPLVEPLSPEVKHCFEPIEDLNKQRQQATAFQSQQWAISNQRFLIVVRISYVLLKFIFAQLVRALCD